MFKPTLKINDDLWARVKHCAERAGYASPEEFAEHVLQQEVVKLEEAEQEEIVVNRLKGLGYLE
jgi:predicted transcriptional regulator